ncbi:MAG: discoidin domain-containing protein, partial [Pirellulaceae bacterium]|nr:discoidin domain-containing protein [Pirellulaceae bacterium]
LASSPTLSKLTVTLPAAREVPMPKEVRFNYAVNNDGDYFPRFAASIVGKGSSLNMICDGESRYDIRPVDRWTALGSESSTDWVSINLGMPRTIDTVKVNLLDDGSGIVPPKSFDLQYHNGKTWTDVPGQTRLPQTPAGRRPNTITFAETKIQKLRVVLHHADGAQSGLTEIEVWGPGKRPYQPPSPPKGNIAANSKGKGFPKATCSHHDIYGGIPSSAIDGRIIHKSNPVNRWTSYGSPNKSDWLEIDFGEKKEVSRAVIHIYDDRGGVQAPTQMRVETWNGTAWVEAQQQVADPKLPVGSTANTITFSKVTTSKLRIVFTHKGKARSGATEIEVWRE